MPVPVPDDLPDDASLARRVGQAVPATDPEAKAELCRRLAPRVRLYGLRHLRGDAAATDLMQQVMLMMIGRLRAGSLREPEQLASFVFGMCRMVVLELRRGHARQERLLDTWGDALLSPEAPLPTLDHERLAGWLAALPDRAWIIGVLRICPGLRGIIATGPIGAVLALVYRVRSRRLLPAAIGHGVIHAVIRTVLYLHGGVDDLSRGLLLQYPPPARGAGLRQEAAAVADALRV